MSRVARISACSVRRSVAASRQGPGGSGGGRGAGRGGGGPPPGRRPRRPPRRSRKATTTTSTTRTTNTVTRKRITVITSRARLRLHDRTVRGRDGRADVPGEQGGHAEQHRHRGQGPQDRDVLAEEADQRGSGQESAVADRGDDAHPGRGP